MKNIIIHKVEDDQIRKDLIILRSGNTVEVQIWVTEGNKKRLQIFEGIIISVKNRGLNSAFTVRRISSGEGVERVFQTHSPSIKTIIIKRFGMVRKSKLYYLRALSGKAARIKDRLVSSRK